MDSGEGTMGSALGNGRRALAEEVPVGYKRTEVGVIPKHWQVVDIGSLNPFVTSGSRGWARFYAETGAPFIRISNLTRQSIDLDLSDLKTILLPSQGNAEASRTQLQDEDILISITADIGIIGIVDSRVSKPAYMNQHIALIRFDKTLVCARFVAYSLASAGSRRLFVASMDIGAKAGMSLLTVRKIRFALPPFPEQRAIAEALSDVDELLVALEALIAKKRAVKQAAMQQLLTGKSRLPRFSGAWETKRLGEIAPLQRGFDLPTAQIRPGSYAVVYSNGVLQHHERAMVKGPGVVTGRSGTIGKVHFIEKDYWPHNTALWVTSFRENDPKFIYYLYTHINLVQFLSGSGVPTLNRNDVHQHIVAYPPPLEQRTIATVLSDMDAEIAVLERRRDKTRVVKQGMMQQLLTGRVRLVEPEQSWR